ncbi:hypothetical protein ABZ929_12340 [Streptomyces physcomitrii]|uniref:hypothetical protein n=1 Tax=Streptomyces physcomitrii TaxID=2724184 RepID=UPI0033E5BCAB
MITLTAMVYALQVNSSQADLALLAMTAPLPLLSLAFGIIGGPLADLSLSKVPHKNAGSASGLFNTSIHLGMALGAALTALVFFSTTGGTSNAALNRDAFTSVIWWVSGAFVLMWALMLLLPTRTPPRTD